MSSFTLEAYVRVFAYPPATWPQAQIVFRGDDRVANDSFTLAILPDGRPLFFFDDLGGFRSNVVGASALPRGRWLHVAAVFDATTGRQSLFVDHIEVAFSITSLRPIQVLTGTNAGVAVGHIANPVGGPQFLNAQVAEVRISNVPLVLADFLPRSCPADYTTTAVASLPGYGLPDFILTNDDFFYFLSAFAQSDLELADITNSSIPGTTGYGLPNGVIGTDDFFFYLNLFASGC